MKKYPVTEIFGPTIQGEGECQGIPAYFIRFGGCDYKCDWCDTPYAVLPHAVRAAERLETIEIIDRLNALPRGPRWVVLTGGNPVLHELSGLVDALQQNNYLVAVETQGTRWKDWIRDCDSICVSPKPPSSQMNMQTTEVGLANFFKELDGTQAFIKIVVFDNADYSWAQAIRKQYFFAPFFLSAGNDAGKTVGNPARVDNRGLREVQQGLLEKFRWLVNKVMVDPAMCDVTVQSQQHVLLWGNEKGH
jgi:7-carboxy-7-deazaguanine synthase